MNFQERLLKVIPGGAHTYSRGFDQFPANAPPILVRGKGAYVFDPEGRSFLDYGMALRAVTVGYAEDRIDEAAIAQIRNGNNLTRPSLVELDAAELLTGLIDSADMVKFTKNGSTSVTAAVKLARAFTGRRLVLRCADHPFFSFDDWFIGSTVVNRGVPSETISSTKSFPFNDIVALQALVDRHPGEIACVVMEAATTVEPLPNYLAQVKDVCQRNGIVFVLDEMITGFRWHLKGAQHYYGVSPDLCTFGKGMANGYSVSCIAGRREIMELGAIEFPGMERVFLLSTTHGAEMCGLGAFVETVRLVEQEGVIDHIWEYGSELLKLISQIASLHGIERHFVVEGLPCSPGFRTLGPDGKDSPAHRTLFMQEMVRNGILMPWIALSRSHGPKELERTASGLDAAFGVYRRALDGSVSEFLEGPSVKPVFRRFN